MENLEVGWVASGFLALLAILIKTSPKLVIALALGVNMGDILAGIFPGMKNDIQQQKQERLETKDKEDPSQTSFPKVQRYPAILMSSRVFIYTTESPLSAAEDDY